MTRVLLSGATGFIGRHFVKRALSDRHEVCAIVRESSSPVPDKSPYLHVFSVGADETAECLSKKIRDFGPEVAIHLATLFVAEHRPSDVSPLIRSNLEFPTIFAEAMSLSGVNRLLNVSTAWQHYRSEAYNPATLYAATKQAFEDILKFYAETRSFSILTLTLNDTFGPNDTRPKLFSVLAKAALSAHPVAFSAGGQSVDPIYIDDVVDALLIAMHRLCRAGSPPLERFSIRSGNSIGLRELVDLYADVTQTKPNIAWGGRPYRAREFMSPPLVGDVLPGWAPKISLREGIARIAQSNV